MRSFSISFLLTGIILSVVYKNNHDEPSGSGYLNQLYNLSADTIKIDTSRYFLEPFLCRNTSDSASLNSSILALIYLVDASNQRIPTNVFIKSLYVIHDHDIWTSSPSSTRSAMPEFMLTKITAEEPVWENTGFDVIAEVTDTLSQRTFYVISRNQVFADL